MKVKDLNKNEYLPYFQPYIDRIGDLILLDGLEDGLDKTIQFFKSIPAEKLEYSYAEGKWSIKEIINHLIDSERVFAYRALRFARKDKTPVAGFEENDYAIESFANNRTIEDLLEEYILVRKSTIALYKTFGSDSEILKRTGIASGGEVSVRALGFLVSGHEKHHCEVIKERYL
ncbi:putative damage-inducible protein DinB [Lacinutrix venerupis]|uniref:Damage-inducible protein DinB n=1 Tax=Lacinutrix venerupis TaxID=1486034 RepID=A0AAC9PX26_9FLAO|nr:DinB family protein [Lacinutrix venerupis]APY00353.1 damage-inducible protein DinB [Lacinutrix venerupis]RLJ68820.1 putative damage-inducible protein DinB [Lacinutrix venerupis]